MKNWHLELDTNIESQIWKNSITIFDTSALLDLYLYSDTTQVDIFSNIFEVLKGNLWITQQTEYEFLKHRKTKIYLPVEKYKELITKNSNNKDKGYIDRIESSLKDIRTCINSFEQETKKNDKHPFLPENFTTEFVQGLNDFNKLFTNFRNSVSDRVKIVTESIKNGNDTVSQAIYTYFQIGAAFSYTQISEIIKEGEFRYKHKLPPGYEDLADKIGVAVYGDLIIWKQIIEIAKNEKKNVIFITNDTKIDWCYRLDKEHDKIERPREELILEMEAEANVKFWMYTTSQFLRKSKQLLKSPIQENTLNEVVAVNQTAQQALESALLNWISTNYPVQSIEFNKATPISTIDVFVILKNGEKLGFEFRGLKTNEYIVRYRLRKGYDMIGSRIIDKFVLLLFANENELIFDLGEQIHEDLKKYINCTIIGVYKENNKFYTLN